jgi:hypothetical protein
MGGTINDEIKRRIFKEGWTIPQCCSFYGRSERAIATLKRQGVAEGWVMEVVPRHDPRKAENWKPISPAHAAVGARLLRHRTTVLGEENVTDMANRLRVSRHCYAKIEAGAYDMPFSHLQRIAQLLNQEVAVIVTPFSTSRSNV